MKPICFYHSADFDGHCSGAIVRKFVPDVELVGYDYGKPFPWDLVEDPDRIVYMVDVSLPMVDMHRLQYRNKRLIWIDHHESAIDDHAASNADLKGLRRIGDAACELCWEYFAPNTPKPRAVHLLGRYDVWDHDGEPLAMAFQYGARAKIKGGVDDPMWHQLLENDAHIDAILELGEIILDYQNSENAKIASACCFEIEFDGLTILACNRGLTNSQLFDSKWDPTRHHAMTSFYLNKCGKWKVSLYTTREDVNCSTIAKRYGGGGHQKAAGFISDDIPYSEAVRIS